MPVQEDTNRLIHEKSPYLLQHAHNPVDWFPWGDEAFEKAKSEGKPVFLSIGYSTCHWCHVMERESFEDEAVASLLNRNFISIKVDREERPDVDAYYMDACMALNGSGGWPLSCFLGHDRKPFFAGTYFPKDDGAAGAGLLSLLRQITSLWQNDRPRLAEAARALAAGPQPQKPEAVAPEADQNACRALARLFDETYGGFGRAPKFPSLQNVLFLLRYGTLHGEEKAVSMALKTLSGMEAGGICDHVGGGFCRYSTDERWEIPHFEKMIYDNAMAILAYSEAAALTGGLEILTAQKAAGFCLREMCDPAGGFYTALDADSEGKEGKYYAFTPQEVEHVLGKTDGARYCGMFHITREGNFEGGSIPHHIGKILSEEELRFAEACGRKLRLYRSGRVAPLRDDKCLALCNGLMIAALCALGRVLGDEEPVATARRCADFVLASLVRADGRLLARWREGEAGIPATSDDYAALIWGFLELYETTFEPRWLLRAVEFTERMDGLFLDRENGGYFLSGGDMGDLPDRRKNLLDGALPSGNAMAAANLVRLARLCGRPEWEQAADNILSLAAPTLNRYPAGCCGMLLPLLHKKSGGCEVVLANGEGLQTLKSCLPAALPFLTVTVCGPGYEAVETAAPWLRAYGPVDGKAAAYVCRQGSCQRPVSDPQSLRGLLRGCGVIRENPHQRS